MKLIKILTFVTVVTVTAIAFFGAGAASATELCKVNKSPCPKEDIYAAGTEIKGEAEGKAELRELDKEGNSGSLVECDSIMTVKTEASSGNPLRGNVTALTFTKCNLNCTATVNELPYESSFTATGGGNGVLTVKSVSATFKCSFGFLKCRLNKKPLTLAVDGNDPAKVLAAGVEMEPEALELGGCPPKADLTVTYKATSPTSVFVV